MPRSATGSASATLSGSEAGLIDPRNGPAWDLPEFAGAPRTYVIASTPRTGSTLLCRSLWDTGLAAAPKEYLNPMQIRDWEVRLGASALSRSAHRLLVGPAVGLAGRVGWSEARLRAHLERVRRHRTAADGLFGLKLHAHHFERWFLSGALSWQEVLAPQRWIRIRREDRVAQAVSWARALQSGRWASHQRSLLPVIYRRRQVERLEAEILRQEGAWSRFFDSNGIEPLELSYEELVAERDVTLRRVLAFLGVAGAETAAIPEPSLAPQADATTEDWIERHRAHARRPQ